MLPKFNPLLVLFMQSVNANAQKHESLSMLIVPFILQDETWILQHLPATSYDELITPPKAGCLLQWQEDLNDACRYLQKLIWRCKLCRVDIVK